MCVSLESCDCVTQLVDGGSGAPEREPFAHSALHAAGVVLDIQELTVIGATTDDVQALTPPSERPDLPRPTDSTIALKYVSCWAVTVRATSHKGTQPSVIRDAQTGQCRLADFWSDE